ncbi:MAG: hypothetical protein JO127_15075 [Caulobacteraceae bacterium]|nr:hypothetical protein [Caulobacteraceae bacterium]
MKLWPLLAAALALAAFPGAHAQTLGQSDDYVCNHGDPSDEGTKQACARLRGDSEAAQFDESVPVRERRAQAPPPAPVPAPAPAAKGAVAAQTLAPDTSGSGAPALTQARPAAAPVPSLTAPSAGAGPSALGAGPPGAAQAPSARVASATAPGPAAGLALLTIGGWISIAAGTILGLLAIVLYIGERSAKARSPA